MSSAGHGGERFVAALAVVGLALAAGVSPATAQVRLPNDTSIPDRERDRLPRPDYAEPGERPDLALPPIDVSPRAPQMQIEGGFVLRGVRIRGSSVFGERTLARAVAPFLDREVRAETLPALTDAITRLYVDAGYVSSGAIVPEQEVEGGLLEIRIVEGSVGALEVETSGRLREGWVEARVRRALAAPFSLPRLDETLRILQLDPRVARVDAVVLPSPRLGESRLRLRIEEARHWTLRGRVANDLATALGGRRITGRAEHRNVTGRGDTLRASTSGARGLFDAEVVYRHPVGPWLTEIELRGSYAEGEVVEGDLSGANFRNEIHTYGLAFRQPLWRGLEDEVSLTASVERRTSELTFGDRGDPFPLEVNGRDGDVVRLLLLRLDADWVHREAERVFAARLRATFGLDAWDASSPNATVAATGTPRGATLPDAEFQAMLLQLQYAQRIDTPLGPGELIARGDLQLASGSLFSLEQFAMGGSTTVRGFAENEVVADNGTLASVELRVPILPARLRPHALRLAPFVDFGFVWDDDDDSVDVPRRFTRSYESVGLGLLYDYGERFAIRIDYGRPLVSGNPGRGEALQRHGLHVEATLSVF